MTTEMGPVERFLKRNHIGVAGYEVPNHWLWLYIFARQHDEKVRRLVEALERVSDYCNLVDTEYDRKYGSVLPPGHDELDDVIFPLCEQALAAFKEEA